MLENSDPTMHPKSIKYKKGKYIKTANNKYFLVDLTASHNVV